ncbi:MAG TPA: 5-(carboxyamino)imidazole ribonucleotide synthase [Crinalium sp.]
MKRVGVIGGGQLAWMMADAAQKLGIELIIQTPSKTDPAVAIATHTVLAPVADARATADLAAQCDVITFENEFVDLDGLSHLAQQGTRFYPQLEALAPLLDKYHQRCFLKKLGIPVPDFRELMDQSDTAALSELGFPVVLKARRHGYDGQGTYIIQNQAELEELLPRLERRSLMLEAFVPFEKELAIMVARSINGDIVTYPVVETQQENQVCRRVLVTGEFNAQVTQQAEAIARTLMENLQVVGIFGIELFLTPDGTVLVNEIAPRTHNSGHFTLDACVTSQFEQQLRAVCGLPLGSPDLTCGGAVMVNLLGYESSQDEPYLDKRQQFAQIPQTHVYWYGKTASRPGRKLGHVTTLLDRETGDERRSQALSAIQAIESIWYP